VIAKIFILWLLDFLFLFLVNCYQQRCHIFLLKRIKLMQCACGLKVILKEFLNQAYCYYRILILSSSAKSQRNLSEDKTITD